MRAAHGGRKRLVEARILGAEHGPSRVMVGLPPTYPRYAPAA